MNFWTLLFKKKPVHFFLGEKNPGCFFGFPPPSMCFFSQPYLCAFLVYGVNLLNN